MSQGNAVSGADAGDRYGTGGGQASTIDTAQREAADLKDTATDAAKDVAKTANDEAGSVARETKVQVQDLVDRTRRELSDQAATQKARLAVGLRSIGSELTDMARSSDGTGLASDLVQQAADRASRAATWLGDRDPAALVSEVRGFARRRPAVFIAVALLAGVVVGRLTRALATNGDGASPTHTTPRTRDTLTAGAPSRPVDADATTEGPPLYAESATRPDADPEVERERSDAL